MESLLSRLADWRRDRRRRRNLRMRARVPAAVLAFCAAAALIAAGGAIVLWRHAGSLAAQAEVAPSSRLAALQGVMPGLRFTVPDVPGVTVAEVGRGRLLVASGLYAGPAVRVDLCSRPLPLHAGYRFSEAGGELALRHALLVEEGSKVPAISISSAAGGMLGVRWRSRMAVAPVQWSGDAPGAAMRTLGWLTWAEGAMRVERRASKACAQGALRVQLFAMPGGQPWQHVAGAGAADERAADVVAFPAQGEPVSLRLAAGRYEVPQLALAAQEDEVLFKRLRARGLLRMRQDGLIELAPPDLPQWLAAPAVLRAGALEGWQTQAADDEMRGLLKRLYRQADGEYVRRQVDLFNSERRLLAWRLGSGSPAGISVKLEAPGGGPLGQSAELPPVAVRLFADLPEGWEPWSRAANWMGQGEVALVVQLPGPASGRERIELLLAGSLVGTGASATANCRDACSGPACRKPSDVQAISLRPAAGTSRVVLRVRALDVSFALHPGDQAYRHVRVAADGAPAWHPIGTTAAATRTAARFRAGGGAVITDREGKLLWSDGAPTPGARAAGLSTLLGLNAGHAASVAGMLSRAAQAGGQAASARLSISLPLQAVGQAILECQGLRNGKWHNGRCEGAGEPPPQRRAGLLLLDADNGDILLAAGAGGPQVGPANWREARDFDRANPARSPLRIPGWQHDGGAHSSPGSAFKIISALGLEMAARHDRALDALLGGMPLEEIDRLAQQRGFAFRSDAAAYPFATQAAHVTNYREQNLVRRAESGRLGLAQAMTYSVNTWFAWTAELSDRTLQGRADGGAPGLRALEPAALDQQRPIAAAAAALGFGTPMRLDGGLLPAGFAWQRYDALQSTPARIDPIDSRHELRQMAIGLRMQATPLQMAVAAAAIGSGRAPVPRLMLALGEREAEATAAEALPVRLDRIRKGMKGVVDSGTAAGAFNGPAFEALRRGLYGKTGTAPVSEDRATVWFTGWLEPGSLPGQQHRLAFAAFISHSELTGGGHAAPIVAALLKAMAVQNGEQKGNPPSFMANGWAATVPR